MSTPPQTSRIRQAPTISLLAIGRDGACIRMGCAESGVRRLTQQHFEDARMAANMMLGRWSSQGVNLWQVDLQCINLVQGQSTYQVPSNTIVMLDGYVRISTGANPIDRLILPVSRTEYASYANKSQQGFPTVFWFDRLLSPTVTLWPVPNGQQISSNIIVFARPKMRR